MLGGPEEFQKRVFVVITFCDEFPCDKAKAQGLLNTVSSSFNIENVFFSSLEAQSQLSEMLSRIPRREKPVKLPFELDPGMFADELLGAVSQDALNQYNAEVERYRSSKVAAM